MSRKKINDNVERGILSLLQLNISQRQIVKILGQEGITISQRTLSNVERKIGLQRASTKKSNFSEGDQRLHPPPSQKYSRKPTSRTLQLNVPLLKSFVSVNPLYQASSNLPVSCFGRSVKSTNWYQRTLPIVANVHVDLIDDWPIIDTKTLSPLMNLGSILMEQKGKGKFVR